MLAASISLSRLCALDTIASLSSVILACSACLDSISDWQLSTSPRICSAISSTSRILPSSLATSTSKSEIWASMPSIPSPASCRASLTISSVLDVASLSVRHSSCSSAILASRPASSSSFSFMQASSLSSSATWASSWSAAFFNLLCSCLLGPSSSWPATLSLTVFWLSRRVWRLTCVPDPFTSKTMPVTSYALDAGLAFPRKMASFPCSKSSTSTVASTLPWSIRVFHTT